MPTATVAGGTGWVARAMAPSMAFSPTLEAGEDGGVIGDAGSGAQLGDLVGDVCLVG